MTNRLHSPPQETKKSNPPARACEKLPERKEMAQTRNRTDTQHRERENDWGKGSSLASSSSCALNRSEQMVMRLSLRPPNKRSETTRATQGIIGVTPAGRQDSIRIAQQDDERRENAEGFARGTKS